MEGEIKFHSQIEKCYRETNRFKSRKGGFLRVPTLQQRVKALRGQVMEILRKVRPARENRLHQGSELRHCRKNHMVAIGRAEAQVDWSRVKAPKRSSTNIGSRLC